MELFRILKDTLTLVDTWAQVEKLKLKLPQIIHLDLELKVTLV